MDTPGHQDESMLAIAQKLSIRNVKLKKKYENVEHKKKCSFVSNRIKGVHYGLEINTFLDLLKKHTGVGDAIVDKVRASLDHKNPQIVTWGEFITWFQNEGEVRDNVHNAQLY